MARRVFQNPVVGADLVHSMSGLGCLLYIIARTTRMVIGRFDIRQAKSCQAHGNRVGWFDCPHSSISKVKHCQTDRSFHDRLQHAF